MCKHWPLTVDAKWKKSSRGLRRRHSIGSLQVERLPTLHQDDALSGKKVVKDASTLNMTVDTVDAVEDAEEMKSANVSSFPTIKLIKAGKVMEYSGERDCHGDRELGEEPVDINTSK